MGAYMQTNLKCTEQQGQKTAGAPLKLTEHHIALMKGYFSYFRECKKMVGGVFEKTNEDCMLLCFTVERYYDEPSYNDFLRYLKTFHNAILQF